MSTDGCSVWSAVDDCYQYGWCLEQDPFNHNTVYSGGNIYDSGTTTYQAALCKSTDTGVTWGPPILLGGTGDYYTACRDISVSPADPTVIYAGGQEAQYAAVWRSANGGVTWSDVSSNLSTWHSTYDGVNTIWTAPGDPDFVLIGTTDGVFKTTDGGVSWSNTTLGSTTEGFAYHPWLDTLYAATTTYGVYKSEDGGSSWQTMNDGLEVLETECIDIDFMNGLLYLGTDGGSTWRLSLPAPPLAADSIGLSAGSGGTVDFSLDASATNGNRYYLLLGGVTGTEPGYPLPGGMVTLPLNWDVFTNLVLDFLNSPLFYDFLGTLNNAGRAAAQLNAPPLPPTTVGVSMYYAYCLNNPFDYVSNPVEIEILP